MIPVLKIKDNDGNVIEIPAIRGVSVTSVVLISGDHSPGTTDTYRMQLSDGSIYDYQVYNGKDGKGSGGGASSWSELTDKPFETIGNGLKVVGTELLVDTADAVEQDNTKPITAAAVYTTVGNINTLLSLI